MRPVGTAISALLLLSAAVAASEGGMREEFLRRLETLPAHEVTLLATPPGVSYRMNLTPEYLRKWGCAFSAPAGSPGARKLADILRAVGEAVSDPGPSDFRIGILSEGFTLYLDKFGFALSDQGAFAYPKATVAALTRLARSADFHLSPDNTGKDCQAAWRMDAP